ncbi:hypothetical protein NNJEOMEG_00376 [Fundidesulfovibrio magnetotacticus]|uniref:CHAT domain-containing protein n=1 Tax=Fundidesulfovibrio magnetotacticus TaxID=2730080 RepID=A0A6V8LPT5_9BACT|nr:CHAT domain-containing tetratricopeptide repeat protein [Fundidesulfovibrio magnetotacticus]GFK92551.1 hypothetical protein NNJEOMEG_00376 [Fundidesulfovibrio magnetotacticus]
MSGVRFLASLAVCAVLLSCGCSTYKTFTLLRDEKPQEALPLAEKALAEHEASYGPDSTLVGYDAVILGETYRRLGEYEKARLTLDKALGIFLRKEGENGKNVLFVRYMVAEIPYHKGDFAKAEALFKELVPQAEKVGGPNDQTLAKCLANLATIHADQGRFAEAKGEAERALAILIKTDGAGSEIVAAVRTAMSQVCMGMEDLACARDQLEMAKATREKLWGPGNINTAISYGNLAVLYAKLKDYQRSEEYSLKAMGVLEKNLPPDHPHIASLRNNLSFVYQNTGRQAEALKFSTQAMESTLKTQGAEHPDMALRLNNMAVDHFATGDIAKATELMGQAVGIVERTLGPNHPTLAQLLNNQAGLFYMAGRVQDGLKLLERAKAISAAALGKTSEYYSDTCYMRGLLEADRKAWKPALEALREGQEADDALIDRVMGFATDQNKLTYLQGNRYRVDAFLSLALDHLRQDGNVRSEAMNLWLRRKGAVLEAQKQFQEALVVDATPEVRKQYEELSSVRSRLASLSMAAGGGEGAQKEIARLEARKAELENKLASLSRGFAKQKRAAEVSTATLAQALPKGSALVEFSRFRGYDFAKRANQPDRYLAFVLASGNATPSMVDLGPAQPIDEAAAGFVKSVRDAANSGKPAEQETQRYTTALHDLVFKPLRASLAQARQVFLSPDGALNLFPFEILTPQGGKPLLEEFSFSYLSAGRDMLAFDAQGLSNAAAGTGKPALFGDPDFNLGLKELAVQAKSMGYEPTRGGNVSRALRGQSFRRLPGTATEVRAIKGQLADAQVFLGASALEEALLTLKRPRVLHLATHGFFLEGGEAEGQRSGILPTRAAGPESENPLLRSGVLLAGANSAIKQGGSEGVVTAEKLLSLNLNGTELVVLSACETGLGDVKNGEGVFGLRRALLQAGAQGLVMSLWSVPDRETGELMAAFYRNLATGKMTRPQALRQAMQEQRTIVRERHGSDNPYYWGAFVYLGEP